MTASCAWTQDFENGYWETACNNAFDFDDGGPRDNGFNFCPYCGAPLAEYAYVEPVDDDEDDVPTLPGAVPAL